MYGAIEEEEDSGYNDSPSDMLYGRRLARFLSQFSWYHPKPNLSEGFIAPSLDAAWEYFEHMTLGRYVYNDENDDYNNSEDETRDLFKKATLGEKHKKTKLYPLFVNERELADFGIGVGIYFRTLRFITIIFFIAFLINLPLYFYYASTNYSDDQQSLPFSIHGSAACTKQIWQPCPSCLKEDWSYFPIVETRFAEAESNINLKFIKVNECKLQASKDRARKKMEIVYDEIQQTASDYSITVANPPKDAKDPEEWKTFFQKIDENAHVTFCTVVLDNEDLINALALKKIYLLQLDLMLPVGVQLDETKLKSIVDKIPPLPRWKKLFSTTATSLYDKIIALDNQIEELSKKEYDASDIFVTFNTEKDQRSVLEKLSVGTLSIITQNKDSLPSQYLFRGEHVLDVFRPAEPSSIRWQDLDETFLTQMKRSIITFILSLSIIAGGGVIIALCKQYVKGQYLGFTASAFFISFFNGITPRIVKQLMRIESHRNEGSYQTSLFLKTCLFRWTNTALILYIITPFASTLTAAELLITIFSIFYTELFYTPITFLSDYMGHFQRHYLAPRAVDQRRMNLCFQGSAYTLAERYTDMEKVIFMTFFYAAIFPAGYLYGAISLFFHYCIGRFCLLRSWAQAPKLGTQISRLNGKFNYAAMLVFVFITMFAWSEFPFDNACEYNENDKADILRAYKGDHSIKDLGGTIHEATVTSNDNLYTFCRQRAQWLTFQLPQFLDIMNQDSWRSVDQDIVVGLFAYTGVLLVVLVLIQLVWNFQKCTKQFLYPSYKSVGEPSTKKYWDLTEVSAYIPQVTVAGYPVPFLLCDTKDINTNFISFEPYNGSYNDCCLVRYIYGMGHIDDVSKNSIFSIVKNWPPTDSNEE